MAPPQMTVLFVVGDEIEVSSDEEGFKGAWFEASVVRPPNRDGRYTVAYDAFVDDADKSSPLRETVDAAHIRPRPPPRSPLGGLFHPHQSVEALHNDAWWSGVVSWVREGRSGVDGKRRYSVRFGTGEECVYGLEELRPRMEWVGGEWVEPAPQDEHICGATSFSSSAKQVRCSPASKTIAEDQQSSAFENYKASMKATIEAKFKEFTNAILSMPQFSQQPPPHLEGVSPMTEGSLPQSDKQYVHILSSDQKTVAKGYISDQLMCHGRTVAPDECCVWVEEVYNPEIRIYEAPQFGHTLLGEVADGVFIIWLRSRVRFI